MKKQLTILLIATMLFAACAKSKQIGFKDYEPYGLIDRDEVMCDSISYKVNAGNVVWSVVLSSTVVVPVWLIGYQLYEPIGRKSIKK